MDITTIQNTNTVTIVITAEQAGDFINLLTRIADGMDRLVKSARLGFSNLVLAFSSFKFFGGSHICPVGTSFSMGLGILIAKATANSRKKSIRS